MWFARFEVELPDNPLENYETRPKFVQANSIHARPSESLCDDAFLSRRFPVLAYKRLVTLDALSPLTGFHLAQPARTRFEVALRRNVWRRDAADSPSSAWRCRRSMRIELIELLTLDDGNQQSDRSQPTTNRPHLSFQ
jgi:hypothetical protein